MNEEHAVGTPSTDGVVVGVEGLASERARRCPSLVSVNPSRVRGDTAHEAALLVELDQRHLDSIACAAPGGADNVQDICPLSPLQEGMLFHHLMNAAGDTYILSTLFELESAADDIAFVEALQAVVERHDGLRSAVFWEGLPQPLQVVYRQVSVHAERAVMRSKVDALAELKRRMRPWRTRMDLQRSPLLRLTLATCPGEERGYALLEIHHVICDYRSWRTVVDEILACFRGRQRELLPPAACRDYVAWTLHAGPPQAAEAFFRGKLSDVCEPSAPFGLLNTHGDGSCPSESRLQLQPSLARAIRGLAIRYRVTPARLFHAAWALVVAHTSGRDDVVYGTALLASPHRGSAPQSLIAMSVNTLPLRLRLRSASARRLVEQTNRELDRLLRHDLAPLTLAQRCSGVGAGVPLFTTLLNCRRVMKHRPDSVAERARVIADADGWTNYPIAVTVDDDGEDISITAQVDLRIDPTRILAYLRTAMNSLVTALDHAPSVQALSLEIVPADERSELERFNANSVDYQRDKTIHQLFEEQVMRTPTAVAVTHGNRSMTYVELDARAEQLAATLRQKGVLPDDVVAICVDRGIEMVVGLLGILKAGGAYLPLDPTYPPERLQYMLEDAAPRLVLAQKQYEIVRRGGEMQVIELDRQVEVGARWAQPAGRRCRTRNADNLLYVIYTSGSTGRPKGTAMPHSSMVNLIEWQRTALPDTTGTRVLQFAALSFDVAFQEIFTTLCSGGTLLLVEEWVRRDVRALFELLRAQRVERLFLPPMMLQALAEYANGAGVAALHLRDVITAGEQLRISDEIRAFFARAPTCRLHNHYGPTETHVVTALTLTGSPDQWPALPTIGRPIANTQIHVLDQSLQPVPLGVIGEIYIGGANLARGYLKRPDLTAARFVANPFDSQRSPRLYKTGDLGRWRPNGTIEYLGRNDDQVKIRGFRIELGEVEAQLARHEHVREVAVVAREDAGGRRLVAYATLREPLQGAVEKLRAHAEQSLPEHMVPSAFVVLEQMPLTPSGKLNRRALPPPDLAAYAHQLYEAPDGALEQTVAGIWQELLHVTQIGRNDDFFGLGGHSLNGMRLMVAIEERLRVRLPVVAIFQHPTLARFARCVADASPVETSHPQAIARRVRSSVTPLSYSQQARWAGGAFLDRTPLRQVAAALHLRGNLRRDLLQASWEQVVQRHEALRTRLVFRDGAPMQEVASAIDCRVKLHDLIAVSPAARHTQIRQLIKTVVLEPFAIDVDPLCTLQLARLGPSEYVLILALEHMIADGYSVNILWRDLFALYARSLGYEGPPLPAIAAHFADYALWQQELGPPWIDEHREYWQELGACPPLHYQTGDAARVAERGWGAVSLHIGRTRKDCLQEWCRMQATTLPLAVFTAHVATVLRWCRADAAVIRYNSHGRTRPELEHAVGFFAAPLYLHVSRAQVDSPLDLLQRIKEEYCRAQMHADMYYLEASAPGCTVTRSTHFNWIPLEPQADLSILDATPDALECTPIRFSNPLFEVFDVQSDPIVLVHERPEELSIEIMFPRCAFTSRDMHSFAGSLRNYIEALPACRGQGAKG